MYEVWEKIFNSLIIENRYQLILGGLKNTLFMSLIATGIGCILGFMIAITKVYSKDNMVMKILNGIAGTYVTIIRGTPVMLQLLIMYNIVFISGSNVLLIATLAFGINSSAYVSEIIRAGIMSIDRGQFEGGLSLGLSKTKTMMLIILPQAIKNILPALFNEFIVLLKETSVAGYIGVCDLVRASDIIKSRTYDIVGPLVVITVIYLTMVVGLTSLLRYFERRMSVSDSH